MLKYLFDTSGFLTRNQCGSAWTESLSLWSQVSGFIMFLSYVILIQIFIIVILWYRWRDISWVARLVLFLFSGFIFTGGFNHLFNGVIVFHEPYYRFFTLWSAFTAFLSFSTSFTLFSMLPWVLRTPTAYQYQVKCDEAIRAHLKSEERNRKLRKIIEKYESDSKKDNYRSPIGIYYILEELNDIVE